MPHEMIALVMFASMMLMLMTGQRVFAAIGFVGALAGMLLWGTGGVAIPFSAAMKLMKWYPLLTLPMFIFMGYVLSESRIADDLYRMFHVWMGPVRGGLAIGTIGLMVLISAMNGLSVAGMAIGATIALPELLRRGYDKIMVTGVIQAGSSLGILVPRGHDVAPGLLVVGRHGPPRRLQHPPDFLKLHGPVREGARAPAFAEEIEDLVVGIGTLLRPGVQRGFHRIENDDP